MKSSIPNIVLLWLRSPELSRLMLGVGALLLAIEGTWSVPIHTSSVFGVYIVLLLILLGLQLPRLRLALHGCPMQECSWFLPVRFWEYQTASRAR